MVETKGLVASIEANRCNGESTNVTPDRQGACGRRSCDGNGPRRCGSRKGGHRCSARAAGNIGELVSVHVIPRPHGEVELILPVLDAE